MSELSCITRAGAPCASARAGTPALPPANLFGSRAVIVFTGTTSAELQAAINGAAYGDVIQIVNSFNLAEAVLISSGMNITVRGATGNEILTTSDTRHFVIAGSMILDNITLDGGGDSGGVYVPGGSFAMTGGVIRNNVNRGVYVDGGVFILEGGAISGNTGEYGSGALIDNNGRFFMSGGIIGGNSAADANISTNYGGGVAIYNNSQFVMNGGAISGNRVTGPNGGGGGGGVFLSNNGFFEMNNGVISNNTATAAVSYQSSGGGVLLGTLTYVVGLEPAPSTFIMNGGIIEGNDAKYVGGGVAIVENSSFTMNDGVIRGNFAITGNGGGGVFVGRAVFAVGVSFTMNGGAISGNHGAAGGGVLVEGASPLRPSLFTMMGGEISGNFASSYYGGGVCLLSNNSTFIMGSPGIALSVNPLIRGNAATAQGGGVFLYTSVMTMYNGQIAGNTAGSLGGGICVYANSRLNMAGGLIGGTLPTEANMAVSSGGGAASFNGGNILTITGGRIAGNMAQSVSSGGGGVYVGTGDTATIAGEIVNNAAAANDGGGVFIADTATAEINGGIVGNNRSAANGGGVYVTASGQLAVTGASFITGNSAGSDGGGIYTANYADYASLTPADYQNITTAPGVVFVSNTAAAAYMPPAIAAGYTNIGYASTSIRASDGYLSPINNYDINYVNPPAIILYRVIYEANGGSGAPPVDNLRYESGASVTVLGQGGLMRAGYTFSGWNTLPAGGGIAYSPADTVIIFADVTLYAQWAPNEEPVPPGPGPRRVPCPCHSGCRPVCAGGR